MPDDPPTCVFVDCAAPGNVDLYDHTDQPPASVCEDHAPGLEEQFARLYDGKRPTRAFRVKRDFDGNVVEVQWVDQPPSRARFTTRRITGKVYRVDGRVDTVQMVQTRRSNGTWANGVTVVAPDAEPLEMNPGDRLEWDPLEDGTAPAVTGDVVNGPGVVTTVTPDAVDLDLIDDHAPVDPPGDVRG